MRPGTRIGPYEVVATLGSGGAGAVFHARAGGLAVAIKVLHRRDAEAFARFDRERRLLASFGEAEGFVPLLDAGITGAMPYLVMPLLGGGTLRSRLEKGPLSVDDTVALGTALARALGRAHARGVVHRDVKPENVLFAAAADATRPLLADLGLAKHFAVEGDARSLSLSRTGVFRGTAGYMPPEQMRDGKTAGPPADVFALGAVLYECLAGRPAFTGETPLELVAAVENAPLAPLARVRRETPAWLARAIERALAHAPGKRFADGDAFARALAPGAERSSRPAVLRAVRFVLPLGLLVAAAVAALAVARREGPPAKEPPATVASRSTVTPPRAPAERDLLAGFRDGPSWKLRETWGRFEWKLCREVLALALAPDGTRALAGGEDRAALLLDARTGRELWSHRVRGAFACGFAFSPDGARVLVGGDDAPCILDARTGAVLLRLEGHGGQTSASAFAPDGESVLTAGGSLGPTGEDDRLTIKQWNARSGALLHTVTPRDGPIKSVAFSADGARAFAVGNGGAIVVLDLASERELARLGEEGRLTGLAVAADGRHAVTSDNDKGILVRWDLETGKNLGPVGERFVYEAFGCALSADGAVVVGAGREALHFWRSPDATPFWSPRAPCSRFVALTRDGRHALSGHQDGTVRSWDPERRVELGVREGIDGAVRVLRCAEGVTTGVAMTDDAIELQAFGARTKAFAEDVGAYLHAPSLSSDGALLLVIVNQHPAKHLPHEWLLLDARTGEHRRHVKDLPSPVFATAIAPDGKTALLGDGRGAVVSLDLETGDRTPESLTEEPVTALAFLDDGESWLAGGKEGAITFGRISSAPLPLLRPAGRHEGRVTALAARRRVALSGDGAGRVKVWDVASRTRLKDLEPAQARSVTALALAPGGRLGASASEDGTIAVWDMEKLARVATIDLGSSDDMATALDFESERVLRAGTGRGVVHAFDLQR